MSVIIQSNVSPIWLQKALSLTTSVVHQGSITALEPFLGKKFNLSWMGVDSHPLSPTCKFLMNMTTPITCVGCGTACDTIAHVHITTGGIRSPKCTPMLGTIHQGMFVPFTIDHIVPVSVGGDPKKKINFQPMCKHCNFSKQNLMSQSDIALVSHSPDLFFSSDVPENIQATVLRCMSANVKQPGAGTSTLATVVRWNSATTPGEIEDAALLIEASPYYVSKPWLSRAAVYINAIKWNYLLGSLR